MKILVTGGRGMLASNLRESAHKLDSTENEYIFSGRLELDYLQEKYDFRFTETEAETLSGFIVEHHETIPKAKERIIIGNFEFDVLNVNETRIETVKMKLLL